MASLQYVLSCTTTPIAPRSSSSRPAFTKQSHFITHANRSRRLRVSCQNHKEGGNSKIDRRNMLLGLGGLYGAANLISTPGQASADPIAAPELDKCVLGRNWNRNGQPLDEHCCLINSEVVDYEIPPSAGPGRIRKPVHLLTPSEVQDFEDAIAEMKRLDRISPNDPHSFTQQSRIHCAYCNASYFQPDTNSMDLQVHHNWLFFPFHRWYLYFFERICGQLIGKPDFALPYWNWDHPDGMTVSPIFTNINSPLYDNLRDWENAFYNPTKPVSLGGPPDATPEQTIQNNIAVMYSEMMTNYSSPTEFMGVPYRKGTAWRYDGEGKSETGSHNMIHYWIGMKSGAPQQQTNTGEDMGNFYSAGRDPMFYCHHSNVDRMWAIWQGLPTGNNKFIRERDFLDTQFIFYDENKRVVRVKVEDCIDVSGQAKLGYRYLYQPTPWQDYTPPPQSAEARAKRASTNAPKAEDVFPSDLKNTVTVIVSKTQKGKADEYLEIENITYDTSKFVKFDVFVNDEDDDTDALGNLQRASFAGTFSQVPTKSGDNIVTTATSSIKLRLTDLYDYMDVADDDTVLVTLVPRHQGPGIKIGGIKIIVNPFKSEETS